MKLQLINIVSRDAVRDSFMPWSYLADSTLLRMANEMIAQAGDEGLQPFLGEVLILRAQFGRKDHKMEIRQEKLDGLKEWIRHPALHWKKGYTPRGNGDIEFRLSIATRKTNEDTTRTADRTD